MWLYQAQGLFMICAPDTDVNKDSYGGCTLKRVTKKTFPIKF